MKATFSRISRRGLVRDVLVGVLQDEAWVGIEPALG